VWQLCLAVVVRPPCASFGVVATGRELRRTDMAGVPKTRHACGLDAWPRWASRSRRRRPAHQRCVALSSAPRRPSLAAEETEGQEELSCSATATPHERHGCAQSRQFRPDLAPSGSLSPTPAPSASGANRGFDHGMLVCHGLEARAPRMDWHNVYHSCPALSHLRLWQAPQPLPNPPLACSPLRLLHTGSAQELTGDSWRTRQRRSLHAHRVQCRHGSRASRYFCTPLRIGAQRATRCGCGNASGGSRPAAADAGILPRRFRRALPGRTCMLYMCPPVPDPPHAGHPVGTIGFSCGMSPPSCPPHPGASALDL
jgi:hypothetical protein